MNNSINFTNRSNQYLEITKKGWNYAIPQEPYRQINNNRKSFEKFARKNNIKITFTDASNMLPECHSGSEIRMLSNKLAMKVEKRPSIASKIKSQFSHLKNTILNKPTIEISTVSYYSKDCKSIPSLKEKKEIGFFVDYDSNNNFLGTIVDLLQKTTGKKSDKLSNIAK